MLELLSLDYDAKLQAYCVNARCHYDWLLKITQNIEDEVEIQRNIFKNIDSTAYATLSADLKQGCLLPPLVLAVKNVAIQAERETLVDKQGEFLLTLTEPIKNIAPENVYIIDGLQRSHAIRQISEELLGTERDKFLSNRLHIEIWLNISFKALAYRMFLINAGQQPLSVRQQVEILTMKLCEELITLSELGILFGPKDKRKQTGQFHIANLSQAFQAWLQGQPNLEIRNPVVAQTLANSAINLLSSSMADFKKLIEWLVNIDYALPKEQFGFLSNENVLLGIAAAVGAAERNITLHERMVRGLENLFNQLRANKNGDPLGIQQFEKIKQGFDTKKVNIGQATREMVFGTFQEYFYSDSLKSMQECWQFAAGRV
ncbi:hypothetical protein PN36_29955 [Candidatus Thiomargarita nelsonii]|uniref:DUF262 domain-containing protein n=1 Tax=Candidatus Thiomargarita nelsonii TaxID=1003181 RepID=A0A0A6P599_9GAMM|nr:hypothetical protein PN36_29955 [Candidatus Thiomargarita nelsonii]